MVTPRPAGMPTCQAGRSGAQPAARYQTAAFSEYHAIFSRRGMFMLGSVAGNTFTMSTGPGSLSRHGRTAPDLALEASHDSVRRLCEAGLSRRGCKGRRGRALIKPRSTRAAGCCPCLRDKIIYTPPPQIPACGRPGRDPVGPS
jgi:hypothetical protein